MDMTLIQDFKGANNPREALLEAIMEERPFTTERTLKALDALWDYAGKAENIAQEETSETSFELAQSGLFVADGDTYQRLMINYGNAVHDELLATPEIVAAFKTAFPEEWGHQLDMLSIDIEEAEEDNLIEFHLDRLANA